MSITLYLGLLAIAIGIGAIVARGFHPRRWPLTAILAVGTGLYGHLAEAGWASWVAIAAVLSGFVIPGILGTCTRRAAGRGDFRGAARWARRVGFFRAAWRPLPRIFWAAAEHAEGRPEPADRLLVELSASADAQTVSLHETLLSLTHNWEKARFASTLDVQARALCELGEVERGIETLGPLWHRRMGWAKIRRCRGAMLGPLAFAGEVAAVAKLCELLRLAPGPTMLWHSTALAAGGDRDEAIAVLDDLDGRDATPALRTRAAERRNHLPTPVNLSSSARSVLETAITEIEAGHLMRAEAFWHRPLLLFLVTLVGVGFAFQSFRGGSQDPYVALSLGALVAEGHLPQEPWRLLAYGFLHYGWLHLMTNILGLAVLGPLIARLYGGLGLFLVFLLGIGIGGVGISLFGSHGLTVGASAGVMALMGALVVGCRFHPRLRPSLSGFAVGKILLVLMVLQTLLDAITPMVSSVGHGVGAVVGAGAGAVYLALIRKSE